MCVDLCGCCVSGYIRVCACVCVYVCVWIYVFVFLFCLFSCRNGPRESDELREAKLKLFDLREKVVCACVRMCVCV